MAKGTVIFAKTQKHLDDSGNYPLGSPHVYLDSCTWPRSLVCVAERKLDKGYVVDPNSVCEGCPNKERFT